jgi:lipid-A-disaccharide synthase
LRVGIVATELSGDILGAGLIQEIVDRFPNAQFEGIAGPAMMAAGCRSMFPLERLSVMGLIEVLRHLPELLSIRRTLAKHFIANPPDLFIGIDGPDFNLGLERKLKRSGIPTVHYVCPSFWAWRPKRIEKIRKAANLVLSILPFEQEILQRHRIASTYVGHPMADDIPIEVDQPAARERLELSSEQQIIALLPGSRRSEVEALADTFLQAAMLFWQRIPDSHFVVPLVNSEIRGLFEQRLHRVAPGLPVTLLDGNSRDAMLAADAVLVASGTATLEALLLKRPMIVAYRLHPLTYWILTRFRLLKIEHVALANLLAGREIAPEYIQGAATPGTLARALYRLLASPNLIADIKVTSTRIHQELRCDASRSAADAVLPLIKRGKRDA